jgi:hypothetical protein
MSALSAQREKSEAARKKTAERRKRSNPQAELHAEWSGLFREAFGADLEVPKWGPAERSLASKLAKEFGFDETVGMVRHFIGTWKERAFDGVPSVKLLWSMRQRVLAEISGAVKVNAKAHRILNDEWDKESSSGPSEGWG